MNLKLKYPNLILSTLDIKERISKSLNYLQGYPTRVKLDYLVWNYYTS